ncbi:hypothetical protein Dsin_017380 [Dipteronia sinensis]|uniref:Transmembrane protein n=1 Tax=Dipteronia sinensis TaxID=43782 RepID=A0AAE0E6H5_9ROSI|nr:hypothetical protein Dsin_017380 [Dipteronia sinensis]
MLSQLTCCGMNCNLEKHKYIIFSSLVSTFTYQKKTENKANETETENKHDNHRLWRRLEAHHLNTNSDTYTPPNNHNKSSMFQLHALSLCLLSLLLLLLLLRLCNNFLSDGLLILILEMGFGFCMSLWYKVVDLFNFTLAS